MTQTWRMTRLEIMNCSMKAIYDEDSANTFHFEEQSYKKWEREKKNQILSMTDTRRKQEEWSKVFPVMTLDDSYLNSKDLVF